MQGQVLLFCRSKDESERLREIFTHKEDFLKKENNRRAFAVKFTVKWWWMKVFNRMFSHWRMLTAHSRGVLARHVRNIQARRLRRVFWLWREWQLIRFVRR